MTSRSQWQEMEGSWLSLPFWQDSITYLLDLMPVMLRRGHAFWACDLMATNSDGYNQLGAVICHVAKKWILLNDVFIETDAHKMFQ